MSEGIKSTVILVVKKLPFFYGTRTFITVFTKARHWTQVKSDSVIALKFLIFIKLNISSFGTQNFTGASNVLTQIHALNVGILMGRKGGRREKTRKRNTAHINVSGVEKT